MVEFFVVWSNRKLHQPLQQSIEFFFGRKWIRNRTSQPRLSVELRFDDVILAFADQLISESIVAFGVRRLSTWACVSEADDISFGLNAEFK